MVLRKRLRKNDLVHKSYERLPYQEIVIWSEGLKVHFAKRFGTSKVALVIA